MALTILSAGLFGPSFIASVRRLKKRRVIAALNILGLATATLFFLGALLWIVSLVLSLVLKEQSELKQNEGAKGEDSYEEGKQKPRGEAEEVVPELDVLQVISQKQEEYSFNSYSDPSPETSKPTNSKMGFIEWLTFQISIRPKIKSHEASLIFQIKVVDAMKGSLANFNDLIDRISDERFSTDIERNIFEINGCLLIEVRKGARVSYRESTYSGSSRGGSVRIGRVRVGGSSSGGSSSSTSISYPAPDELTQIDQGKFIITSLRVSFSGSMFTKTTEFKKIVDFTTNGRQILIAPKTGSKIWIAEFPSFEDAWIAAAFLNVAFETPEKRLDSKGTLPMGNVYDGIRAAFSQIQSEISSEIKQSEENLDQLKEIWNDFKGSYPNYVKDLNF